MIKTRMTTTLMMATKTEVILTLTEVVKIPPMPGVLRPINICKGSRPLITRRVRIFPSIRRVVTPLSNRAPIYLERTVRSMLLRESRKSIIPMLDNSRILIRAISFSSSSSKKDKCHSRHD